jgi:hypothetical protein
MKMTNSEVEEVSAWDCPVNWPLVLSELKESQKDPDPDRYVAIVINGYPYKVYEKSDLELLINALEAVELPPAPISGPDKDENKDEDPEPEPPRSMAA